jgi:Dehydrogenases with different specificities (related to short-chain alcohol dehydrogenases)
MGKLDGKIAVITGATSGIGCATAKLFAEEGAVVLLLGRNRERGKEIEDQINSKRGLSEFVSCDVTSQKEVISVKNYIEKNYKRVDILFNNAGVFITSRLEDIAENDWSRSFETNINSAMYMTKAFIDLLMESHGNIINNASISGLQSFTSGTSNYMYGTSKAALVKFSKICALNYARDIRVNCICPGIIDTEIYTNRDFSRFKGMIPMERIANPVEVAKVVVFLASDDASYITGAVLPVDGGASLK